MKYYKKSKSKWKKERKALKKQNKILFIIAKNSSSRRELNNIKKIRAKASKNRCDPSRDSSGDNLESDSDVVQPNMPPSISFYGS